MNIKIIIADDHELVRRGMRSMLQEIEHLQVIGEAEDGRQCIELARKLNPDVIIMDVTMPSLNGIEATRQILAEHQNMRIVAVSMHPERQFVTEMLAAGASAYLVKDSPLEELVTAVETVFRGGKYLSPKLSGIVLSDRALATEPTPQFCGRLSAREREVLQMVAEGKNTKEIAYLLHLSTKTVEGHRRQVMEKLNIYSVAELTRFAIREGVTSLS
jgi:DNA-binding NarL/FixJ family response regulator